MRLSSNKFSHFAILIPNALAKSEPDAVRIPVKHGVKRTEKDLPECPYDILIRGNPGDTLSGASPCIDSLAIRMLLHGIVTLSIVYAFSRHVEDQRVLGRFQPYSYSSIISI